MRTIQLETLRINLSKELANLKEPIEILKRGKVIGYMIKEIEKPKEVNTGKTVIQPSPVAKSSCSTNEDIGWMIRRAKAKEHAKGCTCEFCGEKGGAI